MKIILKEAAFVAAAKEGGNAVQVLAAGVLATAKVERKGDDAVSTTHFWNSRTLLGVPLCPPLTLAANWSVPSHTIIASLLIR